MYEVTLIYTTTSSSEGHYTNYLSASTVDVHISTVTVDPVSSVSFPAKADEMDSSSPSGKFMVMRRIEC